MNGAMDDTGQEVWRKIGMLLVLFVLLIQVFAIFGDYYFGVIPALLRGLSAIMAISMQCVLLYSLIRIAGGLFETWTAMSSAAATLATLIVWKVMALLVATSHVTGNSTLAYVSFALPVVLIAIASFLMFSRLEVRIGAAVAAAFAVPFMFVGPTASIVTSMGHAVGMALFTIWGVSFILVIVGVASTALLQCLLPAAQGLTTAQSGRFGIVGLLSGFVAFGASAAAVTHYLIPSSDRAKQLARGVSGLLEWLVASQSLFSFISEFAIVLSVGLLLLGALPREGLDQEGPTDSVST